MDYYTEGHEFRIHVSKGFLMILTNTINEWK